MPTNPTKWTLVFTQKANKVFKKLDREAYRKVTAFIDNSLLKADNPRTFGKPLTGNLKEFWCYRVGDYRLICELHDHVLTISVIKIGHRKEVYD